MFAAIGFTGYAGCVSALDWSLRWAKYGCYSKLTRCAPGEQGINYSNNGH
jgi:hypothetical protein